jgi:hypothetical protein
LLAWPKALDLNGEALSRLDDGYSWVFLAMAYQCRGRTDEARGWLDRAAGWLERATKENVNDPRNDTPLRWSDEFILDSLRREAEGLILGRSEREKESPKRTERTGHVEQLVRQRR